MTLVGVISSMNKTLLIALQSTGRLALMLLDVTSPPRNDIRNVTSSSTLSGEAIAAASDLGPVF